MKVFLGLVLLGILDAYCVCLCGLGRVIGAVGTVFYGFLLARYISCLFFLVRCHVSDGYWWILCSPFLEFEPFSRNYRDGVYIIRSGVEETRYLIDVI